MATAGIWGAFLHETKIPDSYYRGDAAVTAVKDISLPTPHHERSSNLSVLQNSTFERFLRLYHLLELLFDYDFVEEIKRLDKDLTGIGKLLSGYEADEISRLKALIYKKCNKNNTKLEGILNLLATTPEYLRKSKEIFFKHGKKGNPFGEERETKFDQLIALGGFSEARANHLHLSDSNRPYQKLLAETAAYWIYRTRCCIAHSRIGEYVLQEDDEEFVCEFAEVLLRELIIQAFARAV